MTDDQWEPLLSVADGSPCEPLPVGFIMDSPWLPNWAGISILDSYTSESRWLQANLKLVRRFPRVLFLPGFRAEYGMCTEPSAFGAKCHWGENEFPFVAKCFDSPQDAARVTKPDPRTDGLNPFVLKRLEHCQAAIRDEGRSIRFAVARGPLNIAAFLLGTTEFLLALKTDPEPTETLLKVITDYLVDSVRFQAQTFPSIQGVLILDDVVGFCGPADFEHFCRPCLRRVFNAIDAKVRFFHNDDHGLVCGQAPEEIGVNLFNFSYEHDLSHIRELVGNEVVLVGNIPPRDVLATGSPEDVVRSVRNLISSMCDRSRTVLSCGGGMPPNVLSRNIEAFLDAANSYAKLT